MSKNSYKAKFYWVRELARINIRTIFQYRTALIIQAIGMFINNFGFIAVWLLFFDIFKEVNGWGFKEMIALNGFVNITAGIIFAITYGVRKISKQVTYGQFDRYLVLPKSTIVSVIFSDTHPSAFGDIVFGLLSFVIYFSMTGFSLEKALMMPILIISAVMVFAGFIIITQSIVFWIPNSEDLSETLYEFGFGPAYRPTSAYSGFFKIIFMTLFPAVMIGGFPVDTILSMSFVNLVYIFLLGIVWLFVAKRIFYLGLKRYESGSLVGAV